MIVSGTELLESLGEKPGQLLDRDSVSLNDITDLTDTFTYYFNKGSAAERTFNNPRIYKSIVKAAETLLSKQVILSIFHIKICSDIQNDLFYSS